ncbi:MAG: hypothetical protein E7523_09255 [Ruminococcaceae bacterium]|nr:hypothetical protein [Oscillospiraceae bacterium]
MKTKISVLLVAVILVCTLAFAACSAEEKIIGTWTSQQTTLGVVTESSIVFNEDGTGSVSGLLGLTGNMTYVINENIMTVTYNIFGVESTKNYTFEIKGDTLTLTEDATTVTYTRAA